jgi:2-polyprenyl-3-methyl-5-hydroxy-6-metoxy-1,4-benzoquinol methylase
MLIQESTDYERGGTQKDRYEADDVVAVPCPLCGSDDGERIYAEYGAIGICRCRQCSLLYVSPRLKAPEQIYWGDVDKYLEESRLIFDGKKPHHRDPNYIEELDTIARFKPEGRFLDVGCNMGMLLRHIKQRKWTAVGVDPSPSLTKIAREWQGVQVYNCFLNELPASEERSFDVVALSDVFEHIAEPLPFLADVGRFLRDDGVLYVKVPNGAWNLFKQRALAAMGRRPARGIWDSYEHVVHYTHATLRKMLEKGGFEVIEMSIGKPIQIPSWHLYVGHYYQYPSPWTMDWKRHLGRSVFYWLSRIERLVRLGSIGAFAPNLVAVARKRHSPM